MNESFLSDVLLTNSITNFLFAGWQGAFASLNILSQLGYLHFNPDDLSKIERYLSSAEKWKEDLYKGLPIFSSSWSSPQTVPAKKAFEHLVDLRSDLQQVVGKIRKILLINDLEHHPEEVRLLIAYFARQAYSRENYIRGFIDLGGSFRFKDLSESYSRVAPEAERSIEIAHAFFNLFMSEETLLPSFYRGLREECLFLPGVFQSQVHDINLLLNSYTTPITYANVGISAVDAQAWHANGINPIAAGYWMAWDFSPDEAPLWLELGVDDPKFGWFWRLMGFRPKEAFEWGRRGFAPPGARDWRDRGLTPDEAIREIQDRMLQQKLESEKQQFEDEQRELNKRIKDEP